MQSRRNLIGWAAALLMMAAFWAITPVVHAQQWQGAQQPAQAKSQTFVGRVFKLQGGKYALITGKTPQGQVAGHYLNDLHSPMKYVGKTVKVTGTLNMKTNTIHVKKIRTE